MTQTNPATELRKAQLEAIERLKPLAEELNAQSNDLNQIITVISERLAALNLGIEVWFPSSTQDFGDDDTEIGFGKLDGRWGLAARSGQRRANGELVTLTVMPLTNCSRDQRIEGLTLVPSIVSSLHIGTTDRLKKIAEAKQLATGL